MYRLVKIVFITANSAYPAVMPWHGLLSQKSPVYGFPVLIHLRGMIKKFSVRCAPVRFNEFEYFVSRSFDLIEGHWKCEKHAAMLEWLCTKLLREEDATYLQNKET